MDQQYLYDRILGSLHEAAFDATRWPEASGLIDAACGVKGDALVIAGGHSYQDAEVYFAQFCFRGQRREDFERLYLGDYWSRDERIPRLRRLPDSRLVQVRGLYTEAERKTSATYNEAMRSTETQDSLNVRLDGPGGTRVVWALGDPVDADGWGSDRTRMIAWLLPHLRQFARVRHALVEARALGQSLAGLLDVTGVGVIQLDRRGRMVAANDRAVELLRQRDGLIYEDDVLHAVEPADDAELQLLLERAMPRFGGQGVARSMTVGRPLTLPRIALHVSPMGGRSADFGMQHVAALVLIVDAARKPRIDADLVASALGLTPTESSVAVMLATGYSLREIAVAMRRRESTIRWHFKQIFAKLHISRQADLVRLVLSASSLAMSRR